MKSYLLLLFFSSLVLTSSSQDSFAEQLKKIVEDASNNFAALKGSILRLTKVDTTFRSKINLDGTTDNRIETSHWPEHDTSGYTGAPNAFFALIDSGGLNMGMDVVRQWKRKVANILGRSFQESDFFIDRQKMGIVKGYKLTKGNIEVSVYRSTFYITKDCLIYLGIYMK